MMANAQLLIANASSNFLKHVVEPDHIVDWDDVIQIIMSTPTAPKCPICLAPPVAARVTRCGHEFCLACILRHLSGSVKGWQNCPICDELVHLEDIRSVVFRPKRPPVPRIKARMVKVRRPRETGIVIPAAQWGYVEADPVLAAQHPDVSKTFLRVLGCDDYELPAAIRSRDLQELEAALCDEESSDSAAAFYLQRALRWSQRLHGRGRLDSLDSDWNSYLDENGLRSRTSSCSSMTTSVDIETGVSDKSDTTAWSSSQVQLGSANDPVDGMESAWPELRSSTLQAMDAGADLASVSGCNEGEGGHSTPIEDQELEREWGSNEWWEATTAAVNKRGPRSLMPNDDHIFFQAVDGSLAFLHRLNVKALEREFGSLWACPDFIEAPVIETEVHTITKEVRQRFRYLDHLALDCEYLLVQVDLTSVVSKATLNELAPELEAQRAARRRRTKAEKRHTLAMQRRQDEQEKEVREQSGVLSHKQLPPDWKSWVEPPSMDVRAGADEATGDGPAVEVRLPTRGAFSRAVGGIMSDPSQNPPLAPPKDNAIGPASWGPALNTGGRRTMRVEPGDYETPPDHRLHLDEDALAAAKAVRGGRKKKLVLLSTSRRGT